MTVEPVSRLTLIIFSVDVCTVAIVILYVSQYTIILIAFYNILHNIYVYIILLIRKKIVLLHGKFQFSSVPQPLVEQVSATVIDAF